MRLVPLSAFKIVLSKISFIGDGTTGKAENCETQVQHLLTSSSKYILFSAELTSRLIRLLPSTLQQKGSPVETKLKILV